MAEDLVARLRDPYESDGYGEDMVIRREAAAEIERLTAALERVLHYWQERYGMKFEKTDEVLIDEVRRVQRALAPAPEPRDG